MKDKSKTKQSLIQESASLNEDDELSDGVMDAKREGIAIK